MADISHENARSQLQAEFDQLPLDPESAGELEAHLALCQECRDYKRDITALEAGLNQLKQSTVGKGQPQMSLQAILSPTISKQFWAVFNSPTAHMTQATIMLVLLVGYFVIATYLGIQEPISIQDKATIPPTPGTANYTLSMSPTPLTQQASTGLTSLSCATVPYQVKENETLEFIALQFGTTPDAILEFNHLSSSVVFNGMELNIPTCKNPASHTATITLTHETTPFKATLLPTKTH